MRTAIAAFIAVMLALAPAAGQNIAQYADFDAASRVKIDHAAWGRFLDAYLRTETEDGVNRVDYGAVTDADHDALKAYVDTLEAVDPRTLSREEAFVYWVNLYNAVTVDVILDAYPTGSILRLFSGLRPGPWHRNIIEINGEKISLDDVEHGILRPHFGDNRVHYVINCASYGCPNLLPEPVVADGLDETLDAAARDYVNHPRGARFDARGRLIASSIYDWFQEDFGGSEAGVVAHLREYAEPELAARLAETADVHKFEYDWSLNDAK